MRTSVSAPDPGEFERNQPHNIFNDRRVGGRAKNRAYAKSIDISQGIKKGHQYELNKSLPRAPKQFN